MGKIADPSTIFVIDDEVPITMILQSVLIKSFSHNVRIANSYSEAEKLIDGAIPAMAFIDINLGDGNGYNLIPFIKKNVPGAKIVMMSAYATEGEYMSAINHGADHFIEKPFNKNSIIETINLFFSK